MPLANKSGRIVRTPTTKENRLVSPPPASALAALQPNPAGSHFDVIQPRVLALDLSTARADAEFSVGGNVVMVSYSTNATDLIFVKFDRPAGDGVPMIAPRSIQGVPFSKLYLTHAAIAGATLYLTVFNVNPDRPLRLT